MSIYNGVGCIESVYEQGVSRGCRNDRVYCCLLPTVNLSVVWMQVVANNALRRLA